MSNTDKQAELRKALTVDFNKLYVARFATDWVVQRKLRSLEIDVMTLDSLERCITAHTNKQIAEVLDKIQAKNDDGLFIDPHKTAADLVLEHRQGVLSAIEAERQKLKD